jgi:hypothetical protein
MPYSCRRGTFYTESWTVWYRVHYIFTSSPPRYVDAPFRAVVDNFVDILNRPPTTPACAITPSTNVAPQILVNECPTDFNLDPPPNTAVSDPDAILKDNGMGYG